MQKKRGKIDKLAPDYEALRVSVFSVDKSREPGVPTRDWVWYSGFVVGLAQIAITAIPFALNANWAPFLVTIAGTTLALLHGSVPQWREEKWACPTTGGWTISLTQGNGSRDVIVILGDSRGLDLEILAGKTMRINSSNLYRAVPFLLAVMWLVLLVTVSGLDTDAWCMNFPSRYVPSVLNRITIEQYITDYISDLLGSGLIGMIQNLVVAGVQRDSSALGIHLNQSDTIKDKTVAKVLHETESRYPLVGSSLVPIIFPGGMRITKGEEEFWAKATLHRESQGLSKLAIRTE